MSSPLFHRFSFRAFGVEFEVKTNAPELLERLKRHFPPGFSNGKGRASVAYTLTDFRRRTGRYEIRDDEGEIARSTRLEDVLKSFESRLGIRIAEMAPRRVFVHAGVVARKDRVILLPGRSFTGKTTLVRELIRSGADYYSDEYAVLDSRGNVHPFPRALEIRASGSFNQRKVKPEVYGARIGQEPLPVGLVVLSSFDPESRWKPRKLSPGRAALALLLNTIPARRTPHNALQVIERVVSSATSVSSKRGEASETASAILQYFDDLHADN